MRQRKILTTKTASKPRTDAASSATSKEYELEMVTKAAIKIIASNVSPSDDYATAWLECARRLVGEAEVKKATVH